MSAFQDTKTIELDLLLEAIYRRYGFDFRHYARASIRRRLEHARLREGLQNLAQLQHGLLHDDAFFERLLGDLSVNVTEMFRDPPFYQALRTTVVPLLRQQDHLKIWHAGCSTGEEVYSMAILLMEEGLYDRSLLYATDMNETVLSRAREGIFPINRLREYTVNYQRAGGQESFSDYYTAQYEHAVMHRNLRRNVLFSDHNLAVDGVFGEMHLIICRNVLIYFDRALQNRVLGLFADSLSSGGLLCLGVKESLRFSSHSAAFEDLVREQRIYRRR